MLSEKVEKCLWDYNKNEERLKELKETQEGLMSVHGQSYEAHSVNGVSDPVSQVVGKVIYLEKKMQKTGELVLPVRRLTADLSSCIDDRSMLLWILFLRYFRHKTKHEVKRELGLSGSTLYRRTLELLKLAGSYFK